MKIMIRGEREREKKFSKEVFQDVLKIERKFRIGQTKEEKKTETIDCGSKRSQYEMEASWQEEAKINKIITAPDLVEREREENDKLREELQDRGREGGK